MSVKMSKVEHNWTAFSQLSNNIHIKYSNVSFTEYVVYNFDFIETTIRLNWLRYNKILILLSFIFIKEFCLV